MQVSGAASVVEESRAVALHCVSFWSPHPFSAAACEADQSEHLCPALSLQTKSKMAAITGTQWRGKIRVPKVFSSSFQARTYLDLVPPPSLPFESLSLASWWICHRRFSARYMHFVPGAFLNPFFYSPWPSVACLFGNNNDVLQLPDLIRELR